MTPTSINDQATALLADIKTLIQQLELAVQNLQESPSEGATQKDIFNKCIASAMIAKTTASITCDEGKKDYIRKDLIERTGQKLKALNKAHEASWMQGELNPSWETIFLKDKQCVFCNEPFDANLNSFLSFTKDHLVPQSVGGLDTIPNLVPSCGVCNSIKGNWTPLGLPDWKSRDCYFAAVYCHVKQRREELTEKYQEHLSSETS